jgi:hypothetical protein
MAFDVTPTPVRRRGPRIPAIVVLAVGIGIVGTAVATSSPGEPTTVPASTAPAAAVTRVMPTSGGSATAAKPAASPAQFPSTRGARPPSNLKCHAVSDAICDAVAMASLAILPADAPRVVGIDAWASILCGDSLDCPPQRLATSEPLGSAIVTFARGPQAWVNVVDPSPAAEASAGPLAWIVRWRP